MAFFMHKSSNLYVIPNSYSTKSAFWKDRFVVADNLIYCLYWKHHNLLERWRFFLVLQLKTWLLRYYWKHFKKILTFTINMKKLTIKIINLKINLNSLRIALQRHYAASKISPPIPSVSFCISNPAFNR